MFKRLKRAVCAAAAVVVMAVVSVTAAADYTYQLDGDGLCDEILASSQEINGTEGTFETSFSSENTDNFISLRFKLFNEFLDPEFWNDDSVTVSVDVKLETEGVDIIGCIPAFNSKWDWVNPSGYTNLKYGEWVTVSETGTHFYPDFSDGKPGYLLFQARNNWGSEAPGLVKVSVRNFRITGGAAEQTTAPTETTTPVETDPVVPAETDPVETDPVVPAETEPVTVENVPGTAEITQEMTAENTAENTAESSGEEKKTAEASAPEEPAQTTANTTTSTPQTTTIVTQATAATSEKIDYNNMYETESPVKMIVIIVVIAAVVSVGAVVGYLIYRKKKFY